MFNDHRFRFHSPFEFCGWLALCILWSCDAVDQGSQNSGDRIIHIAARAGDLAGVKQFVDEGGNIDVQNQFGFTALHAAAVHGQVEVARYLIDQGADLDIISMSRKTPMCYAVTGLGTDSTEEARLRILRLLIDAGAKFDAFDGYEALDPVILASQARNLRMLQALISQGAPVLKEYPSQTALHVLAEADTQRSDDLQEILDLLVAAGLAIDVCDSESETPLCHATRNNDLTLVGLLIERGADVNVETRSGDTPILLAVRTGNPAVVKMLMERGADPEVTGNLGLTAIELAERVGADEIAAYLRDINVED